MLERQGRALRLQMLSLMNRALSVIVAEAGNPEPAKDRVQRESFLSRFIDMAYSADVVTAYDDPAVLAIHRAAAMSETSLLRMISIAESKNTLLPDDKSRAAKLFIAEAEGIAAALEELGGSTLTDDARARIADIKSKHR